MNTKYCGIGTATYKIWRAINTPLKKVGATVKAIALTFDIHPQQTIACTTKCPSAASRPYGTHPWPSAKAGKVDFDSA